MFRVTRRYQFACSHRLHSAELSEDENWRIYGKCNNPYGHGHNYVLRVTVRGPADATGQAVNVMSLDRLVEREILRPLDHRNLNCDVDWFGRSVPTSENLGAEICRRLKQNWAAAFPDFWPRLDQVCIEETPRNIFQLNAAEVE
ncbi:MAG: 6-carboxytetrahydropterin synthase [Acidobacteriia bacterium]|nr:6-carboxytetrahydropterin synthase [Terriglobia bacterium]